MKKLTATAALLLIAALGFLFWTATIPTAHAREMTPTELLQANLPKPKTLTTATRAELLDAICAAIRKAPRDAAQIVKAAIAARKEIAADVVGKALNCAGPLNSALVAEIVNAGIAANPEAAAAISERAMMLAPDFRSSIERSSQGASSNQTGGENAQGEGSFGNGPSNQNPPSGSFGGGGGGFNPQEGKCTVCHNANNPHEVSIPCSQVPKYLRDHPGDYEGGCQATRVLNQ